MKNPRPFHKPLILSPGMVKDQFEFLPFSQFRFSSIPEGVGRKLAMLLCRYYRHQYLIFPHFDQTYEYLTNSENKTNIRGVWIWWLACERETGIVGMTANGWGLIFKNFQEQCALTLLDKREDE